MLERRGDDDDPDADDDDDDVDEIDDSDDDRRPLFDSLRKSEAIFWSLIRSTVRLMRMVLPT